MKNTYIYVMYEEGYNVKKEYNTVTWELMLIFLHNVQHSNSQKITLTALTFTTSLVVLWSFKISWSNIFPKKKKKKK